MFSKYASPVRILVRAFNSTYKYSEKDIPEIDLLFITHDHWDHLDYNTFMQLKNRVKHIVTGLGVGAHLEKWGYPANQITELYWWESVTIDNFQITATPSRHFSGRTFKRNTTLWSSFVLKGSKQIFWGAIADTARIFKKSGKSLGLLISPFWKMGSTMPYGIRFICSLRKQCKQPKIYRPNMRFPFIPESLH